ncbi:YdcF family protein [Marivirga sp. S37H4]|uniref:YdcF family protein n=1 Tax=Marivirga aurantiaca TaxID=2802615 RepID=A0A935CAZ9_9BACT|nr:YdcF family protein [Marivirga aurantiaca]MBK6266814.1 YdcF family protein [Marivirga aurantiaca]
MFFILSKTISFLFLPSTLIGLCWLAYFIFHKHRWRKYLAIAGFSLFLLFTNDFLANSFLGAWETDPLPMEKLENQSFHYGVLLTGMTNTQKMPDDRVYFQQNADRLLQAMALLQQDIIDTLYISGGGATALRSDLQESRVLLNYLQSIRFPIEKVKIEDQSRNTVESAEMALDYIGKEQSILLITSASHMPRAAACFEKQGFEVIKFPTVYLTTDDALSPAMFFPSYEALMKWHILFKEWMGYAAYKVAGYL